MPRTPIAIVGRGCVLPGALDPHTLGDRLIAGEDLVSEAPAGRWRLDRSSVLTSDPSSSADRTWSARGGYVRGFETVWDPQGFAVPAEALQGLDPLSLWLLHAGRQALAEVGAVDRSRAGAIVGNLSFPSEGMARFAESVWMGDQPEAVQAAALGRPGDARDRFMSGLPAGLLARALGLGAGGLALDAACASSLYAIKLACDRLADGEVDLMLAGAVNRADDLFIHVGFAALKALSTSGRTRPFHAGADGLVPCEGCALVALERLEDAQRHGHRILGVIEGVGLSNDGRAKGLLAPDAGGQERCLRAAYDAAGWRPDQVGLLECHATGTPVGDGVEIESMGRVFAGLTDVPLGSVKSNLGHPITAAGAVALLKVLAAMERGVRPPTLHVEEPHPALADSPFRLLERAEPWEPVDGVRRAGVSAFGFGGNNAHLLVAQSPTGAGGPVRTPSAPVAICAVGARMGTAHDTAEVLTALAGGRPLHGPGGTLTVPMRAFRIPPKDLAEILPQQILVLDAARDAVRRHGDLGEARVGVIVGMGADAEVARYGARWRLASWAPHLDEAALAEARDGVVPVLSSAGVVGTMPNIPANRINGQLDAGGLGFTVSAEEASGLHALRLGARAVASGELDAAVVGAVDLSCEPVHQSAARALGVDAPPADAAVVCVLRRLADARAEGLPILATLDDRGSAARVVGDGGEDHTAQHGKAHAAHGLVHLLTAVATGTSGERVDVVVHPLGGATERVALRLGPAAGAAAASPSPEEPPGPTVDVALHRAPVRLPRLQPPRPRGATPAPARPVLRPPTTPTDAASSAPSAATNPTSRGLTPPGAPMTQPLDHGPAILPSAPSLPPITAAAAAEDDAPVLDGASLLGGGAAPRIVRLPEEVAERPVLARPEGAIRPAPSVVAPPAAGPVSASAAREDRADHSLGGMDSAGRGGVGAAPATPPVAQRPVAPAPTGPWTEVLQAQHAQLAAVHQQYLAQQAALQTRFLEGRRRAADALRAALTGASVAASGGRPQAAPTPRGSTASSAAPRPPAAPGPRPTTTGPASVAGPAATSPSPAASPTPSVAPGPTPGGSAGPRTAEAPSRPSPSTPRPTAPAPRSVKAPPTPKAPPTAPVSTPTGDVPAQETTTALTPAEDLPGPIWDREQLLHHSSGRISELFGPRFRQQDGHDVQVRMPEPPLLLCDRVVGLDATPGELGTGTIWTETDVGSQEWYLWQGRMPAGVMIESGQADLMLISYMGIDFLNQGERAYRLLGCTLTYHNGLPRKGETLRYDIKVDGHATHDGIRLFFFHYDCTVDGLPKLTVRGGQAGFFTEGELDDSAGILWTPETGEHDADARVDPPDVCCARSSFDSAQIQAFAAGDAYACFGPGFEFTQTHNDTPRIQGPPMLFFHEVTDLDPQGGPWGKGYLRATWQVSEDDWFFEGHFKNDPCMPGTLMFEGCLQALAFYLAGLGFTLKRDGWRFEPVPDSPIPMRCRGQVLPHATELVYEIFVEEVHSGPVPMVFADLLCTVDGLKAFHARRCGLQLAPAWPLDHLADTLLEGHEPSGPSATVDGFPFDQRSMLACAWGKPSEAFGPMYEVFDGPRCVPRLPGPPYLFMSRVASVDGPIGGMEVGTKVRVAYDVPPDAWYFDSNGAQTMPFAVFLEAALQPCGWLASYVGSALTVKDRDLFFRNLDGQATWHRELGRDFGTLYTDVEITGISRMGPMIVQKFEVTCTDADGGLVYEMDTVFGFFPAEALADQKGLPILPAHRADFDRPATRTVDLTERADRWFTGSLRLGDEMFTMIDRVATFDDPAAWAGEQEGILRKLRSEKDVGFDEWFFKAHFFQDPVQPGSLGIEAMIQLLQFHMIDRGLGEGMAHPRFEPLAIDLPIDWTYRGQVIPTNEIITVTLDILEERTDERGVVAVADASLWVDGRRIYQARKLAMRIVDGFPPDALDAEALREDAAAPDTTPGLSLDLADSPWLGDHRPTFTHPAVPMTVILDQLARTAAAAAPERVVVGLDDVSVRRWVTAGPGRLEGRTEPRGDDELVVILEEVGPRSGIVATGVAKLADALPESPAVPGPLGGTAVDDLYTSGELFHGPALQLVTALRRGEGMAEATVDAGRGTVPVGLLHPGVLDAALHGIPHDALHTWHPDVPEDVAGYPLKVTGLRRYAPMPTEGTVTAQVRLTERTRTGQLVFQVVVHDGTQVLLGFQLTEVLLPKGPLGSADRVSRVAFLRDRTPVHGLALSEVDRDATVTEEAVVRASDWLPGTVREVYGARADDLVVEVARRDDAARRLGVHPSAVRLQGDAARCDALPLTVLTQTVERTPGAVRVTAKEHLSIDPVEAYWQDWFGVGRWPVEDLYYALIERFVRRVVVEDPEALEAVRGRPLLFLGNHQVAIESLLFSILASGLTGVPTVTIAKDEHRHTWLGKLIQHCFAYPDVADPKVITYFDRSKKADLQKIIAELAAEMAAGSRSVMVHVEGTRSLDCTEPVHKMSGAFVDMALGVDAPIVPVRFVGGLPRETLDQRIEFPVGLGRQDLWIGRPIHPSELAPLPYKPRKQAVIDAINALGPSVDHESPLPGDLALEARVQARMASTGVSHEHATVAEVLGASSRRCHDTAALLGLGEGGDLSDVDETVRPWLAELGRRLFGA